MHLAHSLATVADVSPDQLRAQAPQGIDMIRRSADPTGIGVRADRSNLGLLICNQDLE
jgi:hypothetical protein